jgi:hypothetical protein
VVLDSIKLEKKYRVVHARENKCRSAVPVNITNIRLDNRDNSRENHNNVGDVAEESPIIVENTWGLLRNLWVSRFHEKQRNYEKASDQSSTNSYTGVKPN